jgi:hypothetical protein
LESQFAGGWAVRRDRAWQGVESESVTLSVSPQVNEGLFLFMYDPMSIRTHTSRCKTQFGSYMRKRMEPKSATGCIGEKTVHMVIARKYPGVTKRQNPRRMLPSPVLFFIIWRHSQPCGLPCCRLVGKDFILMPQAWIRLYSRPQKLFHK